MNGFATSLERWWDRAAVKLSGSKDSWKVGLQTYRSYGTANELSYACRVLRDPALAKTSIHDSTWQNFRASFHRFESDEVPGAVISIESEIGRTTTMSDEEGYANGVIRCKQSVESGWHSLNLGIDRLPYGSIAKGRYLTQCLIPSPDAKFGIISDVDDTVLHTQVTSRLKMLGWSVFGNSYTRLPLPGVSRLYRKLAEHEGEEEVNPVFYVSSSPWNLYPVLSDFLDAVDLPVGPLLLRDMGVGGGASFGSDHSHKETKIADILQTYPNLNFLLLGDSGEEDAAIYSRITAEFPGRILCAYIRHGGRVDDGMIERAKITAHNAGSELLLVPDSDAITKHAKSNGWL